MPTSTPAPTAAVPLALLRRALVPALLRRALVPALLLAFAGDAAAMQVSGRGVSVGGSGDGGRPVGTSGAAAPASRQWLFSLAQDGRLGCAVLKLPGLMVAFPGEEMRATSSGSITLGGAGAGEVKAGSLTITTAAGTATFTFRGRSFVVTGVGTAVEVGKERWTIDEAKPLTLILAADGTVTAEGPGARKR